MVDTDSGPAAMPDIPANIEGDLAIKFTSTRLR